MNDNSALRGLVFAIKRSVVEHGPGLRTTLFLKECPLGCVWCSTPECQSVEPQLSFYSMRCIGCGACVEACPRDAQIVSPTERRVLWEKCDNCGECTEVCPSMALEMSGKRLTVEQVMNVIERDMSYYRISRGGVTFSGGEPTAQPEFLVSCLKKCKELGIRTALDTCGFTKWSSLEKILPYVDLFLYDIKHMDSRKHKQFTGFGNELILENLQRTSQQGKPIWITVALIPGYNDSKENLSQTAEFVKTLGAVEKVLLLPYNYLADTRHSYIGRNYELGHVAPHSKEDMMAFLKIFSRLGVKAELSM